MGAVTRMMITGAAGFVGRSAVAEARARGIDVVAVVRGTAPDDWRTDAGITLCRCDLSDPDSPATLRQALSGTQAVIHAAAHVGGDLRAHAADTARATRHLIAALDGHRLVLVSSIAVYDTMRVSPGDALTEDSPRETPESARDAYTAAKLRQEALVADTDLPAWLLRPGAVWGPGRTWHALMGFWASKVFVAIRADGLLPLVHVQSLADTLITAACTDPGGQVALNVVDDDLPTRAAFIARHRALAGWPRLVLPMPYAVWMGLARMLSPLGARLPGLLQERILRARLMPLSYPNTALRQRLGGHDPAPFDQRLADALREGKS